MKSAKAPAATIDARPKRIRELIVNGIIFPHLPSTIKFETRNIQSGKKLE